MFLEYTSSTIFLFIYSLGVTNREPAQLFFDFFVRSILHQYQKMIMVGHKTITPDVKYISKILIPLVEEIRIISFLIKELINLAIGSVEDVVKFSYYKRIVLGVHVECCAKNKRDSIA
jgi:hypothetical protein